VIRRVVEPRGGRPSIDLMLGEGSPGPHAPYSIDGAYAYCERIARGHFENYPLAVRFLPDRLRPHLWALYAFARSADDFADEPRYAGRRREALAFWEAELERAYHGEATHPVFIALVDTIERCEIPISPLRDLLTAYAMDLSVTRYSTWESLLRYCTYAAHPVGRLSLYVFGYRDAALFHYSDDLCTALQLTKSCQDLLADLSKDRIYLPAEDLQHFGVTEEALFSRRSTPELRDLIRFEVARARALFERGRPLLDKVGGEVGFELSLVWHAGAILLDKIEAADFDVFRRRPRLHAADKARLLARAAATRWPSFA
jgi:squalene synthase HpnC